MERPLKCDVVYFDTKPAAWNVREAFGQVPVFRFQCTKAFPQRKISFRDCDASFSLPRRLPFFPFHFFFFFRVVVLYESLNSGYCRRRPNTTVPLNHRFRSRSVL